MVAPVLNEQRKKSPLSKGVTFGIRLNWLISKDELSNLVVLD
jgi:hypothetical protein